MSLEFRIVLAQLAVTLVVAGLCVFYGKGALSALLGGGCVVLPAWYAAFAFRRRFVQAVASDKHRLWGALWAISLQKMIFTGALCSVTFLLFRPLEGAIFFGAFIAAQVVFAFALIMGGSEIKTGQAATTRRS